MASEEEKNNKTITNKATIEKPVMTTPKEVISQIEETELSKIRGSYFIRNVRKSWLNTMSGNIDGRSIHEGVLSILAPQRNHTSGTTITGLTNEQAKEFAVALGLGADKLLPYSDFWETFFIRIPASGLYLNVDEDAKNKLTLCLLRANTLVANSTADLAVMPSAEYLITSLDTESRIESKNLETKAKAFAKFSTMSIQDRLDFLKVYEEGKYKVPVASKPDFISARIGEIVDKTPEKFMAAFDNPYFKEAVFLQDCLNIKAISKLGPKYYITGGDLIGGSYTNTLINLASDEWNEIKVSLLGKLEAAGK